MLAGTKLAWIWTESLNEVIKAKRERVNEALIGALHANSHQSSGFDNWDNVLTKMNNQVKKNHRRVGQGVKYIIAWLRNTKQCIKRLFVRHLKKSVRKIYFTCYPSFIEGLPWSSGSLGPIYFQLFLLCIFCG